MGTRGGQVLPSTILSIDTGIGRIGKKEIEPLKDYPLWVLDEAHDAMSSGYQEFLRWGNSEKRIVIGFTATPYRVGGNTHTWWDKLIHPVTKTELRDAGYLCPAREFIPYVLSDKGIKKTANDYNNMELAKASSTKELIGSVVDTYRKNGDNRPTLLFAVNIEHSILMAEELRKGGISAAHCDNTHTVDERLAAIERLRLGEIKVICNVNIFSTGIDIPFLGAIILARKTLSKVLHYQQLGRSLRTHAQKKDVLIFDHVGNLLEQGRVYDEPPAEMEEKEKEPPRLRYPKRCPFCYYVNDTGKTVCENCNRVMTNQSEKDSEVRELDGELLEIGDAAESRMEKSMIEMLTEMDSGMGVLSTDFKKSIINKGMTTKKYNKLMHSLLDKKIITYKRERNHFSHSGWDTRYMVLVSKNVWEKACDEYLIIKTRKQMNLF